MKKVRFGCDVDGVIYRFQDTANYLLKTHWGYDIGEWLHWDYAEEFVSKKAWLWLWSQGITKHGLFRYGSIYKGSREFLDRISKKCDTVIITSRPPLATVDTERWLAYQEFPHMEMHIVRTRINQKKSDILPHCDLYLDDGPHNVEDLLKNTKAIVLLMDRPWNRDFQLNAAGPDFGRLRIVKTWEEVEAEIDGVYKKLNESND